MVVGDLHALGAMLGPHEAHPELVIDPDRVLAAPIPLQGLQLVPGRDLEIVQDRSLIQLVKLPPRDPEQARGQRLPCRLRCPAIEHVLRPLVVERSDHPPLPRFDSV